MIFLGFGFSFCLCFSCVLRLVDDGDKCDTDLDLSRRRVESWFSSLLAGLVLFDFDLDFLSLSAMLFRMGRRSGRERDRGSSGKGVRGFEVSCMCVTSVGKGSSTMSRSNGDSSPTSLTSFC